MEKNLHKLRAANSGHHYVSLFAQLGDVGGAGVTDCHCSVVLQEQICNGDTDDVAASDDDSVLPRNRDVISAQDLDAAFWSARLKMRSPIFHAQQSDVGGTEAIDVFGDADSRQYFFFIDVSWQRELGRVSSD